MRDRTYILDATPCAQRLDIAMCALSIVSLVHSFIQRGTIYLEMLDVGEMFGAWMSTLYLYVLLPTASYPLPAKVIDSSKVRSESQSVSQPVV